MVNGPFASLAVWCAQIGRTSPSSPFFRVLSAGIVGRLLELNRLQVAYVTVYWATHGQLVILCLCSLRAKLGRTTKRLIKWQSLRALSVVASGYGVRVRCSPGPTHCDGKGEMEMVKAC